MPNKLNNLNLEKLSAIMDKSFKENQAIDLLSISTIDGFNIHCIKSSDKHIEVDKLSAIASSVYALSAASAKEISASDLAAITVETKQGNLFILNSTFYEKAVVLTISSTNDMPLGQVRYIATRLRDELDLAQAD